MSGRGNMSCKQLVELVTDYLEGVMPLSERARFDEHLRKCDGCTAYVDQMRATIQLVGHLREDDLAPPVREALLATFRDWKARLA